jgi:MFS family permease
MRSQFMAKGIGSRQNVAISALEIASFPLSARFLLGLGEGGGFPGSAKAVSAWFPPKERSFAFGYTGPSAGAVIAAPLIAGIAVWLGWRWIFFLTGIAGFLWTVVWLILAIVRRIEPVKRFMPRDAACTLS